MSNIVHALRDDIARKYGLVAGLLVGEIEQQCLRYSPTEDGKVYKNMQELGDMLYVKDIGIIENIANTLMDDGHLNHRQVYHPFKKNKDGMPTLVTVWWMPTHKKEDEI